MPIFGSLGLFGGDPDDDNESLAKENQIIMMNPK
jgi:hypothetical protein